MKSISGGSTRLSVDTTELRHHKTAVDEQRRNVDHALEAANHLAGLDDAYGVICRPFASRLDDVHASTIGLLETLTASLSTTVANLGTCADTYDSVDQNWAKDLDKAAGQLGG